MKDHHKFLFKLRECVVKKIEGLQEQRKAQNEKIIGLRFNKWDHKSTTTKAIENIIMGEVELQSLQEALLILEEEMRCLTFLLTASISFRICFPTTLHKCNATHFKIVMHVCTLYLEGGMQNTGTKS